MFYIVQTNHCNNIFTIFCLIVLKYTVIKKCSFDKYRNKKAKILKALKEIPIIN